jgi:hypothetical protein
VCVRVLIGMSAHRYISICTAFLKNQWTCATATCPQQPILLDCASRKQPILLDCASRKREKERRTQVKPGAQK